MATIQDYLNKIKTAIYGKDVRQAIYDAIHQCYEDGKAGATDLIAREAVETARATADAAIPATEKGAANGVATLNSESKIPQNQLWYTKIGLPFLGSSPAGMTISDPNSKLYVYGIGPLMMAKGYINGTLNVSTNAIQFYYARPESLTHLYAVQPGFVLDEVVIDGVIVVCKLNFNLYATNSSMGITDAVCVNMSRLDGQNFNVSERSIQVYMNFHWLSTGYLN